MPMRADALFIMGIKFVCWKIPFVNFNLIFMLASYKPMEYIRFQAITELVC